MKKLFFLLTAASLMAGDAAFAQQHRQCGNTRVAALYAANPSLNAERMARMAAVQQAAGNSATGHFAKGTATTVTIPVVFHIVISPSQLVQIGGTAGVAARCASQITALNADYAAKNADSSTIPAAFKPFFSSTNVRYGLAHTDPAGHSTPGYDITEATSNGFDVNSNSWGGECKHSSSGGKDAWDVNKYLNVWVINFLEGTSPSGILGLTISPQFSDSYAFQFPSSEIGVQVSYGAFGISSGTISGTGGTNYYIPLGAGHYTNLGRTLTHEFGHFFELNHTWGDDNGACPGGANYADDGIADTPPSADANYGCVTFPHVSCTASAPNGDMFMDYMDYSDDYCLTMFTLGQAAVMNSQVLTTGRSYSLTQHPALLTYPVAVHDVASQTADFIVSPNPATSNVRISFSTQPEGLQSIDITNTVGQRVSTIAATTQTSYNIDLSQLAKGVYYVQCHFDGGTATKKIVLQ